MRLVTPPTPPHPNTIRIDWTKPVIRFTEWPFAPAFLELAPSVLLLDEAMFVDISATSLAAFQLTKDTCLGHCTNGRMFIADIDEVNGQKVIG